MSPLIYIVSVTMPRQKGCRNRYTTRFAVCATNADEALARAREHSPGHFSVTGSDVSCLPHGLAVQIQM